MVAVSSLDFTWISGKFIHMNYLDSEMLKVLPNQSLDILFHYVLLTF